MKPLFFLLCFFFCVFAPAKVVEKTLAHVNEEMISLMDLKQARQRLNAGFFDDSYLLFIFNKNILQKSNKTLLDFLLYQKILDLSAKEKNIDITSAIVQTEIQKQRKNKKLSRKAFSRFLVKNGFTAEKYKEFLKKSLVRKLFIQRELGEKVKISDSDLNDFALQEKGKALFTSFKYDLAYLLFPLTSEGKKRAQETFSSVQKKPEIFDTWKAQNKGEQKSELKGVTLSSMNKKAQKALKPLSVGEISKVLVLSNGYHIFKVLWKNPIITQKNQKRKEALSKKLFHNLLKQTFESWIADKKKTLFIQKTG